VILSSRYFIIGWTYITVRRWWGKEDATRDDDCNASEEELIATATLLFVQCVEKRKNKIKNQESGQSFSSKQHDDRRKKARALECCLSI
jgi:hypothetical protein